MKRPDIRQLKDEVARHLQKRKEIIFAYLHGSVLEHKNYNDIDVAAYIRNGVITSHKDVIDYEIPVSIQLERELGKPVDFHVLNFVSAAFAYHATAGILLFCRDDRCRYDFLERTWREYFDYQPFVKAFIKDLTAQF